MKARARCICAIWSASRIISASSSMAPARRRLTSTAGRSIPIASALCSSCVFRSATRSARRFVAARASSPITPVMRTRSSCRGQRSTRWRATSSPPMYDIRDPKFYDEADLEIEMRRVFDVCHTCRMCFSYCGSFPSLFDAIDKHEEAGEGEVDALTTLEMKPVVDLCWQCKLCYVKCPYTPPHKFAVDFPRLMMRAKLVKARREGIRFREKVLGDPDRMGRMSTGRAPACANWGNRRPLLRRGL